MDRLDKTHKKANTETRKEILLNLYYDKYLSKDEDFPPYATEDVKQDILEAQKDSLRSWIDYLTDENTRYPMWAKYWAFQGMLKIGKYDEASGTYSRRTSKTLDPFIEVNPEVKWMRMVTIRLRLKRVAKE